jgi:D-alanine--poly(phosphoribitol) ligase subunit 1
MSDGDVVDRFLLWAARDGSHPAVVSDDVTVEYSALERRVRAIAAVFAGKTAPRVLIALPQSVDAYAAVFAVGLAGGYYSPLNVAAPIDKLKRIAWLFEPDFILATPELAAALSEAAPRAHVVDLRHIGETLIFGGAGTRHHLAYVIFTSGSTGLPKGVMVSRTALTHYVQWMTDTFAITASDRFSQHPNLAFDISMTDIFGALCHGATLYPLSRDVDRMMPARMIARHKITVWNSVPSVVSLMMQASQVTPELLASVRLFNFCGEPLLPAHLGALFAARPDVLIRNTYGPTEATISVTDLPLRANDWRGAATASIAIGPPLAGIGLLLLGGTHSDEGEIVITGPQLADGYWQDQAKTTEVFRSIDVDGVSIRAYFTGDWAERCREGHIYFKERIDFQVKIKGHRVELDEVAAAVRDCGWPVVCVFKRGEALVAVVERQSGVELNEGHLLREVSKKVEAHAVPVAVALIDQMPRNDNDKLDRKAVAAWYEQEKALQK